MVKVLGLAVCGEVPTVSHGVRVRLWLGLDVYIYIYIYHNSINFHSTKTGYRLLNFRHTYNLELSN